MYRIGLLILALLFPAVASAEWYEASTKHFVVYSDDDPERVRTFATRLETFDQALRVLRQVPENPRGPSARVTVYVVGSLSDIERIYPGQGRNIAGFYSPRSTGSVAFVPRRSGSGASFEIDAQRILLHEYAHHFMFTDWPSGIFPLWFVEGFAEFNSTAIFRDDGSVMFGAPPLDREYGVTMMNQMPAETLLKVDPGKMSGLDTYAFYSRAWVLTHFLTFDPERREQLGRYIAAVNAGQPADEAMKVFGSLSTLDLKLTNYVQRKRIDTLTIGPEGIDVGEVTLRKLGAAEAAVMPARLRSNAGVTQETAPEVAELARRLAAPFAGDPAAQNVLAEAEYDVKNYAGAIAAADRALAADPKSVHALLYKGMALQAMAEERKSTDTAEWQEVRRWYIAANKANPEEPQPLILYYRSFKPSGQAPSAAADSGLLYAYALAPYDPDLRIQAARIFLQQDKADEARLAMVPVAYSENVSAEAAAMYRDVLGLLDKSGPAAALAELDRRTAEAEAKAKAESDS